MRAEYRENKEREIAEMKKKMYNYEMEQFAYKNHHLLSTLVQPGVFNSPYNVSMGIGESLFCVLRISRKVKRVSRSEGFWFDS